MPLRLTRETGPALMSGPRPADSPMSCCGGGPAVTETVTIDRLGARGDGIAGTGAGPVYVPYALPGERVVVERHGARGHLVEVEMASQDRIEPFCPYFGSCGGCAIQH